MYGTVTRPNRTIWTETLDHALSLIGIFCGRAGQCSSSTLRPGLWAMSLLSALSLVCGLMLHVSFSTPNTHYGIPRKTVPYQSKSDWLNSLFFFVPAQLSFENSQWICILFLLWEPFWQQLKCRKEHLVKSRVVMQMFSCFRWAEVVQRRRDLQLLHYAHEGRPGCAAAGSQRGHLRSGHQQHLCQKGRGKRQNMNVQVW